MTISTDLLGDDFDRQEILELLDPQTGRLRGEVAAANNRKRAPALAFHVVGPALESSL